MNCQDVQSLLLQSDQAAHGSQELAAHLAQCPACGEMARKLRRLEATVRSLPDPIGSDQARLRFEHKLRGMRFGRRRDRVFRLPTFPRIAIAACVLLALGGGFWAYRGYENHNAIASADALDRAVEWDLDVAQSDSPEQRRQLADAELAVKQNVSSAPLDDEDRAMADEVLRGGAALEADPLAAADHFSQVADRLCSKIDRTAGESPKALDRLGHTYFMVVSRGIHQNLDRAEAAGLDSPERQKRLEKILHRNMQLEMRIERFLQRHPNASREQFERALELHKRQHQRQFRKQQHKPPATEPARENRSAGESAE